MDEGDDIDRLLEQVYQDAEGRREGTVSRAVQRLERVERVAHRTLRSLQQQGHRPPPAASALEPEAAPPSASSAPTPAPAGPPPASAGHANRVASPPSAMTGPGAEVVPPSASSDRLPGTPTTSPPPAAAASAREVAASEVFSGQGKEIVASRYNVTQVVRRRFGGDK